MKKSALAALSAVYWLAVLAWLANLRMADCGVYAGPVQECLDGADRLLLVSAALA